ncbi:MAG: gas vesicle protein [Kouleothrix sp.]|nr:gas vesicle protein [Kouleothrix sp.]
MTTHSPDWESHDLSLLEVLDRALNKGIVIWGDLTLSVADVDLIYVGLKALLCSVDTADRMRAAALEPRSLESSYERL